MKRIVPMEGNREGGWTLLEALAAAIIIGIGMMLFLKTQSSSNRHSVGNTKRLKAGRVIEKHLEDMRIAIAQTATLPGNATKVTVIAATPPDNIRLTRTISNALSPKDGALVTDVKQVDLVASWGQGATDTMKVSTYVSKKF